jgi:hypothetical protein
LSKKWNDIKIVLEYGMLSEDKFYESRCFVLYPTVDDKYLLRRIKENLLPIKLIKMARSCYMLEIKKHSTRISKLQKKRLRSIIARLSYYFALNSKK